MVNSSTKVFIVGIIMNNNIVAKNDQKINLIGGTHINLYNQIELIIDRKVSKNDSDIFKTLLDDNSNKRLIRSISQYALKIKNTYIAHINYIRGHSNRLTSLYISMTPIVFPFNNKSLIYVQVLHHLPEAVAPDRKKVTFKTVN